MSSKRNPLYGLSTTEKNNLFLRLHLLGLSSKELASLLKISEEKIRPSLKTNEAKKTKTKTQFVDPSFVTILLTFCFLNQKPAQELTREDVFVYNILAKYLKKDALLNLIDGLLHFSRYTRRPRFLPDSDGYRHLLIELFGEYFSVGYELITAEQILNKYLSSLGENPANYPRTHDHLKADITAFYATEERIGKIVPPCSTELLKTTLEELLSNLPPRTKEVVRLYYIHHKCAYTPAKLAKQLGISRGAVSTHLKKALTFLNIPSSRRILTALVNPIADVTKERLVRERPLLNLLVEKVDQLEISIRAGNALYRLGISYIGELIEWNDKELLQNGIGKRCLKQIHSQIEILFPELVSHFGKPLTATVKKAFQKSIKK